MNGRSPRVWLWAIAVGLAPFLAPAGPGWGLASPQPAEAVRPGDRLGWHVVRRGETLQRITELYLGTPRLWPENWALNPQLADPDRLRPGQRLRVIVERTLPPRSAQLTLLARRVEGKFHPLPWRDARLGDLLHSRDGVRTYAASSAALRFDNQVELLVSEDSVVFLRSLERSLAGGESERIEIVEGQADIVTAARPRRRHQVEVILGHARARPRAEPGADGQARARQDRAGVAQVMVYGGVGEVEASGVTVPVATGMGTSVVAGEPPAPPEPLLPPPALAGPAAGGARAWSNPLFEWRPVDGAEAYTLEACRDPGCAALIARAADLTATSLRPAALPPGEIHWRVTAVAPSGLDGYPSATRRLTITGDAPDLLPPVAVVMRRGAGVAGPDGLVLGPGGGVVLAAHDDVSGVAELELRWDAGPWERWEGTPLVPPTEAGRHLLEVVARDAAGRVSAPEAVAVTRDGSPPPPPEVGRP